MLRRRTWKRPRSAVLGAAVVLALAGLLVGAGPAQARDGKAPDLPGRAVATSSGVSDVAPKTVPSAGKRALPAAVRGTGITLGKTGAAPRTVDAVDVGSLGCTPFITRSAGPLGPGSARVDFLAEVYCNFFLAGAGQAYLIDRTPGSPFNGLPIAAGTPFFFTNSFYGFSQGAVGIDGRLFEGGRQVEVVFDLVLQTQNGATWGGCFTLPDGLRYEKTCSGLFTTTVSASVGSGTFGTGLAPFNPAATIRDTPAFDLLDFHTSGQFDPLSTARRNIQDAANGQPARTSFYSQVGTTSVNLDPALLRGMLLLFFDSGYTYRVSELAGGLHGDNSRHYAGKAVDVDVIAGIEVNANNPFFRDFMAACRAYGATEVLGPGDPGHPTHVHCAWPR